MLRQKEHCVDKLQKSTKHAHNRSRFYQHLCLPREGSARLQSVLGRSSAPRGRVIGRGLRRSGSQIRIRHHAERIAIQHLPGSTTDRHTFGGKVASLPTTQLNWPIQSPRSGELRVQWHGRPPRIRGRHTSMPCRQNAGKVFEGLRSLTSVEKGLVYSVVMWVIFV